MNQLADLSTNKSDRVAVLLRVMGGMIEQFNCHPQLQHIFGSPVSDSLVVTAAGNEIRIEAGSGTSLNTEQQKVFLLVLDDIFLANRDGIRRVPCHYPPLSSGDHTQPFAIPLSAIANISDDLASNPQLQGMYHGPVNENLMLVADGNDLRIEDIGLTNLNYQQTQVLLDVIDKIFSAAFDGDRSRIDWHSQTDWGSAQKAQTPEQMHAYDELQEALRITDKEIGESGTMASVCM
jgi:hypothetical protein